MKLKRLNTKIISIAVAAFLLLSMVAVSILTVNAA